MAAKRSTMPANHCIGCNEPFNEFRLRHDVGACGVCKLAPAKDLCEDCVFDWDGVGHADGMQMTPCSCCGEVFHKTCREVAGCDGMACDGAAWCAMCKPMFKCEGPDCRFGCGGNPMEACTGCVHIGSWRIGKLGLRCEESAPASPPPPSRASSLHAPLSLLPRAGLLV